MHICLISTLVCILFRPALCTSDDDSGIISRRAYFTDCHEDCTEFVFCGYFEHTRNTQIVKVLFLAANTVTHIIHIYTCLLSMQKNSDQIYVGISSEFCIFYFTHKAIAWYEWLTFGVKTSVHDQETQCWFNAYVCYIISKRLKMASWNKRSIMRHILQKITNYWQILFLASFWTQKISLPSILIYEDDSGSINLVPLQEDRRF